MKWVDEIYEAFEELGGAARYVDLYEYIERTTLRDLTPHWKASVRRTIEDHSSDSMNFRSRDLFEHLDRGFWGIRGLEIDQAFLDARDEMRPKDVVDRVLVREHSRAFPKASVQTRGGTILHFVPSAPSPVGPFCHAAETDGWVMLTGQMPTDPAAPDAPLPDGLEAQARRVMDNLGLVLSGLGLGFADVVQCRVYLTEFKRDFAAFNKVYTTYFETGKLPARTAIGVTALAVDALVEVDCVARRPQKDDV